jgi:hypothetical protein
MRRAASVIAVEHGQRLAAFEQDHVAAGRRGLAVQREGVGQGPQPGEQVAAALQGVPGPRGQRPGLGRRLAGQRADDVIDLEVMEGAGRGLGQELRGGRARLAGQALRLLQPLPQRGYLAQKYPGLTHAAPDRWTPAQA